MAEDNPIKPLHPNAANLAGKRFGRLLVIAFSGERNKSGKPLWDCQCDCGKTHRASTENLNKGGVKSCGCLASDITRARLLKHGHAKGDLYRIWERMISRCHNPADLAFRYYGERGIIVCDRWRESVDAFITDMGPRPSRKYSVNRKDNNGNYEPSNCEWATDLEQARNSRRNRRITIDGKTQCLSAWLEHFGLEASVFHSRLKRDWSELEAISIPAGTKRRKK